MPWLTLILGLFLAQNSWGYPEFIGYKYSSCLTCHFNGHGNGPLNDYGRALWSAEIASRALAGDKTEDQRSESSGFLGSAKMPWWLRPGFKARELMYQTNPGGKSSDTRFILMQAEANVALLLDKDQKYAMMGSFGYAPQPFRLQNQTGAKSVDDWISREHYFRWQSSESLWVYAGMMDKVYGIRIINHTAYSRSRTGLAQNDQSHGVIVHYIQPAWEWSANAFAGNLYQDADLRQKGISTLFEYEVLQAWRIGASALASNNDYVANKRFAIHSRSGLGYGSALLFELGMIQDTPEHGETKSGYYTYGEAIQKIFRGYHLFVVGQNYKDQMKASHPDNIKTGFGLLAFPMARTELRIEMENGKQYSESPEVPRESWSFLAQLHLSL